MVYLPGLAYRPRDAPLQFSKISSWYHNTSKVVGEFFQKSEWCTAQRFYCSVSAQAATIIIDVDTIDIDGVRIGIVQIDTPEIFGPRCKNELILGLKAKEGHCSAAALFHENIMENSVMKPVIAIAMSMALLAPSVAWPVPSRSRTGPDRRPPVGPRGQRILQ